MRYDNGSTLLTDEAPQFRLTSHQNSRHTSGIPQQRRSEQAVSRCRAAKVKIALSDWGVAVITWNVHEVRRFTFSIQGGHVALAHPHRLSGGPLLLITVSSILLSYY